jgi:hypothetical protein
MTSRRNNVVEMLWTWDRYLRLAARGYYNRAIELQLGIAFLKAAGDEEGAEFIAARARRTSINKESAQ